MKREQETDIVIKGTVKQRRHTVAYSHDSFLLGFKRNQNSLSFVPFFCQAIEGEESFLVG